jgi:hypothetical protein
LDRGSIVLRLADDSFLDVSFHNMAIASFVGATLTTID